MITTFAEIDRKYAKQAEAEKVELAKTTLVRLGGPAFNPKHSHEKRREIIVEKMDRMREQIGQLQEDLALLQYLEDTYLP